MSVTMTDIYKKLNEVIAGNNVNKGMDTIDEQDEYRAYKLYELLLQSNKNTIKAIFDKLENIA